MPQTKSIVIYMESIGDARAFLSAAREVALTKPIIVIKAGRTQAAAKAAASHTGALTGSDVVLDAAFRRSGVLRVDTIAELFYMAEVLAKQPRPAGPRLTILTNAGGPGVLATDALIGNGGELAALSDATYDALDRLLPPHWSHNNPIDILGDASPERYAQALTIAAADENSDGLLVILTPQAMTDPTRTAEALKAQADGRRQAGPRELDGRRRRGGRSGDSRAGEHPDVPVPRHGGAHLHAHVALQRQPARALRNAERRVGSAARRRRPRAVSPTSSRRPGPPGARSSPNSNRSRCSPPTAFRPSRRASRRRQTRRSPPRRRSAIRSS